MKEYRIFYKTVGVTTKKTPQVIIRAADTAEALKIFKDCRPWSDIVAIFEE